MGAVQGRLEDGREVAVKHLSVASRQGAKEFMNEAMLLSQLQHKNLVNLYGYCTHGNDKLLVYEYVRNESLDKILFSSKQIPEFRLLHFFYLFVLGSEPHQIFKPIKQSMHILRG